MIKKKKKKKWSCSQCSGVIMIQYIQNSVIQKSETTWKISNSVT